MSATTEVQLFTRVACAAMLMNDGLIVPGARHFSPEMRNVLLRIYGPGYHKHVSEQGFVDTKGRFLSRERAWRVADAEGQILVRDEHGRIKGRRQTNQGDLGKLYSEDLY